MTAQALAHSREDWSGQDFGLPRPRPLTKAWRVKHGRRGVKALAAGVNPVLLGQDAITPSACSKGLPVYGGYFNGTFANLTAFRSDFPSAAYILAITPNGAKGARCDDCEPGDSTVNEAAQFVAANLPFTPPAQGRNDQGKPMVYCSAGDSQAVINAVSALGIARNQWLLFSAHWIGSHICAPSACGYPAADATQYASNDSFDSDVFYAYCFGTVWPLQAGSAGAAVTTLQQNLNKWIAELSALINRTVPPLTVDGVFGALTTAAVQIAQLYFNDSGPSGTVSQELYDDLAGGPAPVSTWAYAAPASLTLDGAGPHSVSFHFTAGPQVMPGLAKFQVVICKGDQLGAVIGTYPRYIDFEAPGVYAQQFGGVSPGTGYLMAVRGMAQDGSHASRWALLHFQTASS